MKKITILIGLFISLMFVSVNHRALAVESAANCYICHGNVITNFYKPTVLDVLDRNLPPEKTAQCKKCHNDFYHPDMITRYNDPLFGYFIAADSLNKYSSDIIHEFHSGVRYRGTACRGCHGTTPYAEKTYNNNDIGPPPNGHVDCNLCHISVAHQNHAYSMGIASYIWLAQGSITKSTQLFAQKNISCTASECHGPAIYPAITKSDGKQLCINCHNTSRNGYDISQNGHTDINSNHISTFTNTPKEVSCTDCHIAGADNEKQNINLITYHQSLGQTANYDFTNNNCSTCHSEGPLPKDPAKTLNGDVIRMGSMTDDTWKTYCDSCHNINHATKIEASTLHQSTFSAITTDSGTSTQATCTNCHTSSNLVSIHEGIAAQYKSLNDCTICHNNPTPNGIDKAQLDNTIATNIANGTQANCGACHTAMHSQVDAEHISTYPETNNTIGQYPIECGQCHNARIDIEHQQKVSGGNCDTCHNNNQVKGVIYSTADGINPKATDCDQCHKSSVLGQEIHANYLPKHSINLPGQDCASCHSSAGDLNVIDVHIGQSDRNGNNMDCNTCHGENKKRPKDGVEILIEATEKNVTLECGSCHNLHGSISGIHTTTFTNNPNMGCATCHESTLDAVHSPTHKDQNGQPMSCDTCHQSQDSKVQDVITYYMIYANSTDASQKAKCTDCHTVHQDADTLHRSDYFNNQPFNCASCHSNILNQEHSSCSTCHDSQDAQVRKAILEDHNTNCNACHVITHTNTEEANRIHQTGFINNATYNCSGCHQKYLTTEHASRVKEDGSPYNCNTCHRDNLAAIQVINGTIKTANKTNCNSCHKVHRDVNEAHWRQYDYDLNSTCQGCHPVHPK